MGHIYIADPLSRLKIRNVAKKIRDAMGIGPNEYFDVVKFLEHYLHLIFPEFHIEIVESWKMPNKYAEFLPETKCIRIQEEVYNGAISGNPRDRFTLAHEIGHLFLHRPGKIRLARNITKEKIPPYKCPEWQANTFAGELLVPPNGTRGMSPFEVSKRFGVSYQAAEIQMNQ